MSVALALLGTCVGCSSADDQPAVASCDGILSLGGDTYWGITIGNRIPLTDRLGRGALSPCREGISVHHGTGMSATVYRLNDYDADTAAVSPMGPGDPFVLWIKATGDEPPFVVPGELRSVIDDNPVDDSMLNVN